MCQSQDDETLSCEIDGPNVHGWPLSVSRKLWFDFLSAAFAINLEDQEALDLALTEFIEKHGKPPLTCPQECPHRACAG